MTAHQIDTMLTHAPLLTELDSQIIEHLQEDGRRAVSAIARAVGANEKTVSGRMRHLIEAGIVQITAVTEPSALGYKALALVAIRTSPQVPDEQIAGQLAALSSTDYVIVATGRFHLYAELICRDLTHLSQVIDEDISAIEGVVSLETFPYLSLYYQQAALSRAVDKKQPHQQGVRPRTLDETDQAIIRELSQDGRIALQKIADKLSVSEAQVRQRISAMQSNGVMQVMGIVNPMNMGYQAVAWVSLGVQSGTPIRQVAEALASLPSITYIAIVAGRFDLFAELVCRDRLELLEVYESGVRAIDGLAHCELSIYTSLHYKRLESGL